MTTIVDPTLTPTTIHVYAAIVSCWKIYGQSPSQHELRIACRCSITSIQKSLKVLRDKGHIRREKFAVRGIHPVDMDRQIYRDPPDPFAELAEPVQYWRDQ